jgi:hypothetical protein
MDTRLGREREFEREPSSPSSSLDTKGKFAGRCGVENQRPPNVDDSVAETQNS